jgi:hypothetical protein
MIPTRVAAIYIIIVLFHYVFALALVIVVVFILVAVVIVVSGLVPIIICWLVVGDPSHLIAAFRPHMTCFNNTYKSINLSIDGIHAWLNSVVNQLFYFGYLLVAQRFFLVRQ